jgi:hypothetical protein
MSLSIVNSQTVLDTFDVPKEGYNFQSEDYFSCGLVVTSFTPGSNQTDMPFFNNRQMVRYEYNGGMIASFYDIDSNYFYFPSHNFTVLKISLVCYFTSIRYVYDGGMYSGDDSFIVVLSFGDLESDAKRDLRCGGIILSYWTPSNASLVANNVLPGQDCYLISDDRVSGYPRALIFR